MAKLVSVAEMRAIEQAADKIGLTFAAMLENAGASLAEAIVAHSHTGETSAVGLVGPGNNGGDTLVALRLLAQRGWKASALLVGDKPRKDDKQLALAEKAGVEVHPYSGETAKNLLSRAAVVLDGLLGTGIHIPLRKPFDQMLAEVGQILSARAEPPIVVGVDCPSGMDCDSGEVAPETLAADLTVTMAAVKQGMLTLPAFEYLGNLVVGSIGLPEDLPEWSAVQRFAIEEDMARSALPERPLDSHKGTFGTALIVAGSRRFPGASLLAGEAAYRCGAGLVTIATVESMQPSLAAHLPEATWLPLTESDGCIASQAADQVFAALDRVTAMLVGPGFDQHQGTGQFLQALLSPELTSLVVDADGLKLVSQIEDWPGKLPSETILTPHAGEMAILTGKTVDELQAGRWQIAAHFAAKWGHVVVLKGAFTVVAAPDGRLAVLPLATPALAHAGTGDVLAGLVTGLRAQGMPAFEAACSAVWLHGQAGLAAAERLGSTAGVLAGDLILELPGLLPA